MTRTGTPADEGRQSCRCGVVSVIGAVVTRRPLPDIANHVVQPMAIW